MTRKIFFLTAARSEYDILYPVIRMVANTPGLRAEIIASAAHLSPFHGLGIHQIVADGFPIAGEIESLLSSESWEGRSLSFAQLTEGLTRLLAVNRPDIVFVAGDREEALAGAIVGNFLRIAVAHLHGGDRCLASDIDEVFRPAISKLSHLHFTATEGHRKRLLRMGESPDLVWTVGASGLDRLREEEGASAESLFDQYGVDLQKPYFLLIYHPASTLNPENGQAEMDVILEGILELGHPVFCSYPNFDPGNIAIRNAIDTAAQKHKNLIVYHNLPRSQFVTLYRHCAAIVGNSSSIVIEAGFLKRPGILVGPRQNLREIGANVVRIGISTAEVRSACQRAVEDQEYLKEIRSAPSIYGDGHAAPRIAEILATIELTGDLLLKTIPY